MGDKMERVYLQVKRIISNIDFNKIYNGFIKMQFLIKYDNYLYGLNELFLYNKQDDEITIAGVKYIIYDLDTYDINIKNIVVEIVHKMFKYQFKIKEYDDEKIKYLTTKKDSNYYVTKYQLNLFAVNIVKGNLRLIDDYLCINDKLKSTYQVYKYEYILENNVGLVEYVNLKLLSMFKLDEYNCKLRHYIDIVEDPCKLLNYINFIKEYSVINLLVNNLVSINNYKNTLKEVDKPLFSFDKLVLEKNKRVKKILMHKMIHARKLNFKGKIISFDYDNFLVCENLFYLPNEIKLFYNGKVITKKGDFILKINDKLEIEEGYECFSIEKILA